MAIGGYKPRSDFEQELSDDGIVAEINITPLTDVFLVLLIIFMVTSSVLTQMGVNVRLPRASQASTANQTPGIIITVTKTGELLINAKKLDSIDNLSTALRPFIESSQDKAVILEGDREAVLGTIVRIMDDAKKAGAQKFSVATSSSN